MDVNKNRVAMGDLRSDYPDGDWEEDFPHENGNYMCNCHKCGKQFFGHKRRVTCKVCAHKIEQL
jgi:hypothetical protein